MGYQTAELEKIHDAGHTLVETLTAAGQNPDEIESKLHEINSRWRELQIALDKGKESVVDSSEAVVFKQQLAKVSKSLFFIF